MHPASPFLRVSFIALVLVTAAASVFAVGSGASKAERGSRSAVGFGVGLCVWLGATWAIARTGMLADFSLPPKLMILIAVAAALTISVAVSARALAVAAAIPWWALIGINAFRLPLELLMHRAVGEGVMPYQMSFTGCNYDILTGISALGLGLVGMKSQLSRKLILAWGIGGSLLLANVVVIAIVSLPTPLRVFMNEPANVWVTTTPFVWLPVFLVQLALLTHILVFRRLRLEAGSRR